MFNSSNLFSFTNISVDLFAATDASNLFGSIGLVLGASTLSLAVGFTLASLGKKTIRQKIAELEDKLAAKDAIIKTASDQLEHCKAESDSTAQALADRDEQSALETDNQQAGLKRELKIAQDSEKIKSSFLANVSHEIRTPLNAIVGFSSYLDDPHIDAAERSECVELIRGNAKALTTLIDGIVEISRLDSHQISSSYHLFEIDLKLEELEEMFKAESSKKNLQIRFGNKDDQNKTVIHTDEILFGEIMTSLLDNAVKFTPNGEVEFGYKEEGDQILFYVSDTGVGIPSAEQEKIFNQFYKVTEKATELYRGLGLGLSITRSLVTLLGGDIWLISQENVGTTFYVRLPKNRPED